MEAYTTHQGIVMPLNRANVNTDDIIPAEYLKSIERTGFGDKLFAKWRYIDGNIGQDDADFVLNQPRYKNATILLAGDNFGCGSSREHAPWSLDEYGFKTIISTSFADIFYNNSFNNGMLLITLDEASVQELFSEVEANEGYELKVDLDGQSITTPAGHVLPFEIDGFRKEALLQGLDAIGRTLYHQKEIEAYEERRKQEVSWIFD
ncbi:MAG TPA: 3-isopropylmalate dehydratase small subunit [Ktedonosporobacter sp.]|nr:3-isopropylmalate dehydratase small subunit [Ktedonosporobacter sp.]